MGTKIAKAAFLVAAMMFFAVLALDIAVPALVLGSMALSIWLVSYEGLSTRGERETTA
ncbi:transposase [Rhizobium sp. R72]|uniref:hypothetical protein n=1 Tax=unclassified Rhizobium TaxID=2613769 RepID=UPI000B658742|nr:MULTISPECIES: hypothetical protein [unclassified Rhizobium]OWV98562.1 transposase [Rhizobium sp. R693]OWW03795.1 transposase [Rhizobium sp. R72]OWW04002.1 transposase [Rhizobium sp. R711]